MKEALKQAIRAERRAAETLSRVWKRAVSIPRNEAQSLADEFWAGGSAAQAAALQACRQLFRPAERCLAEVKGHNVTPDLRDLAALVGSSWPYETAAGVLKRLSGVQLSDERLRQITNEQGSSWPSSNVSKRSRCCKRP